MNILTKISIVVLVLISIAASVVFTTLAVTAPNYKAAYEQQKNRGDVAYQTAEAAQLMIGRTKSEADAARDAAEKGKSAQDSKDAALAEQIVKLNALLATAEGDKNTAMISVAQLGAADKLNATRIDNFINELTTLRKTIENMTSENRTLANDLANAKAEQERQDHQTQRYTEMIAEMKKVIDELTAKLAATGTSTGATTGGAVVANPDEAKLNASLTAVKGDLASINVGSAGGVKQGAKLIIYRDGKFVAYLRVDRVDPGEASGVVIDRQADPVQGDKVTNRLP